MARDDVHRGEDLALARAALTGAALLASLLPAPLLAQSGRWHFTLPGEPRVTYSVLFVRSAAGDATRLLLETPGGRFDLESRQDPSGRDSTESVTDAGTGERLARRLLLSGYEAVPECAAARAPDACLVFTGARGSAALGLSAFSGEAAAASRARVAALVTPAFDAKLAALAPVFPRTPELAAYGDDFLRLVWPGRFPRAPSGFAPAARGPGCDFDAGFGYPCSPAERRRERALTR